MAAKPAPAAPAAAPASPAPKPPKTPRLNTMPWYVPETRVWIAVAVFGFAWHILDLLASHTKGDLSQNTLFVSIASGLFGGSGVMAVIGFWFIAAKKDQSPPPAP